MRRLCFSEAELLCEHAYAQPHRAAGALLHGGFDAEGRYLPPRSALRPQAVAAWQAELRERGHVLLDADPSLLRAGPYPSFEQHVFLLRHDLGQTLWNTLTITGVVEGRGRLLCDFVAPDFQPLVAEDLSTRALGHLNQGLLRAHGLDEGGDPERGIGGHDAMWFAIRDLVFGPGRYPAPELPPRIARPDEDARLAPLLPLAHERTILLLMNVLLIEVRAELLFELTERLLRTPELFPERGPEVEQALALVERIRQDEQVHVAYLRTVLSELRAATFRLEPGSSRPGASILDPMWQVMVRWHAVENPRRARAEQRRVLYERILAHHDRSLLRAFQALEPPDPWARAA